MKTLFLKKQSALRWFGMLVILLALVACRQPASTLPADTAVPTEDMSVFVLPLTATAEASALINPVPTPTPAPAPEQPAPENSGQEPAAQPSAPQPEAPQAPAAEAEVQPSQPKEFPQPTEGIPQTYTLQKDEYPYCIARRFDVNPVELLSLNGLGPSSIVSPGTVLRIPQTGNPFVTDRALKDHPATYTVVAGDTIYKIACAFGDVSPDMIALVNDLDEPYVIQVGDKLDIP